MGMEQIRDNNIDIDKMKKIKIKIKTMRVILASVFVLLIGTYLSGQVVIQRCDLTTGWEGDQPITIDISEKKEGSGSISTAAQTGSSTWFSKSFAPTRTGIAAQGYISFWLYVSDATKMDDGQVEISSSGGADVLESNWTIDKNSVSNGWNLMQLQISAAGETGGGANLNNINFFRIHQTLSGPVTAKIDFIRFLPVLNEPVWPVLDVPEVDNASLDGKVMFGYQGWFNHPDDEAGLGWVHWGHLYEPFRSHIDMYPDMREMGLDEKYPTHYTLPDGSMAPVFSSNNRNTVVRHMKWLRDYNLDGVFIQRFISNADNNKGMAHKDVVAAHVMEGCEKYGRVFAMMYDGVANRVEDMKSDWMHLVDDIGVTNSDRYLHHNGLPLVSLWGYTVRDEATVDQLEEMIEFFTNNPNPKYRAAVKLGVRSNWYNFSSDWINAFKKVDIMSPWFSGTTDYDRGQNWCDENGLDYLPVVHPGFSWYNLTLNYQPEHSSGELNKDPRDGGNFLWNEVNDVVSKNVKSVYIAMFDEVDEGTAMFKIAENADMNPREGQWVTMDMDGYSLPSDWYLRLASLTTQVVRGYEDNKSSLDNLPAPPEGIMTIRITDEANNNDQGAMEFIFPDFPNESTIEISIDNGATFAYSTPDDVGTFTISGLSEGNYNVFVRHSDASQAVEMGDVYMGNVIKRKAEQASQPFPADSATDIRTTITLGWTADEEVVSHYIYFGTSESPEFIKYQRSPSFSPGELEPNATYYWRIDEENGSGLTEGPLWSFTTGAEGGPTDVVVLDYCDEVSGWRSSNNMSIDSDDNQEGFAGLSCVGEETNKFTKKFDTPVNSYCDQTSYLDLWIYVSDVSAFSAGGQIEISSSGKNDQDELNWSVKDLNLSNGWNKVHLAIADAGKMGEPDLSAINFFRFYQFVSSEIVIKIDYIHFTELTMIPYAEPTNLTAVGGDASVTLDWDDNTGSDIIGYNVYRSLESGIGYSKVNNEPVSASTYEDSDLTNGQTYYYIVKAVNSSQKESDRSNEVVISLTTSIDQVEQLHEVKLYPNPASSESIVRLSLIQASEVSVSIFDLSGRELHHFIDKQQWKPGEHTLMLSLNGFEKGTYILNIKVDHKLITEVLIVN